MKAINAPLIFSVFISLIIIWALSLFTLFYKQDYGYPKIKPAIGITNLLIETHQSPSKDQSCSQILSASPLLSSYGFPLIYKEINLTYCEDIISAQSGLALIIDVLIVIIVGVLAGKLNYKILPKRKL